MHGAMLEKYCKTPAKTYKTTDELKVACRPSVTGTCQQGGGELYQVLYFLYVAVATSGGHSEHLH